MKDDFSFLHRAVEIADSGIGKGGGPFGAVIVRNGNILSESYNRVVLNNDPTAHAEVLAIREAAGKLRSHDLGECTLYTSCEPCPMCLGAIYWAGIKRVVYACDRNDAEKSGFGDNMIYEEIQLAPSQRKISFLRLDDEEGKMVFRKWNELEDKTPY